MNSYIQKLIDKLNKEPKQNYYEKKMFDRENYYINNKNKFKEYYEKNKQKIHEKNCTKEFCIYCGRDITHCNMPRHITTKKHKESKKFFDNI
jgi:hypothetical protein